MNVFTKYYKKIKSWLKKHKLISFISLSVCGFYIYKLATKTRMKNVKLSHFLLALSQNAIEEVIATTDLLLYFRGKGSQKWHQTNASILSKERLYKILLKNPNIDVSSMKKSNVNIIAILSKIKRFMYNGSIFLLSLQTSQSIFKYKKYDKL